MQCSCYNRKCAVLILTLWLVLLGSPAATPASECEREIIGTGLAIPVKSLHKPIPITTTIAIKQLEISVDGQRTTVARYVFAEPTQDRTLLIALPITVGYLDGLRSSCPARKVATGQLFIDNKPVQGKLVTLPESASENSTWEGILPLGAGDREYTHLLIVSIALVPGQNVQLEHRFPGSGFDSEGPSAFGNTLFTVRFPLARLELWGGKGIADVKWVLDLGREQSLWPNHCMAAVQAGARFDDLSHRLIWQGGIHSGDVMASVGLYVAWEPDGPVDEVAAKREEFSEALASLHKKDVLQNKDKGRLLKLYNEILDQYTLRYGSHIPDMELICQEVSVREFLKGIGRLLAEETKKKIKPAWLGRRLAPSFTLQRFLSARELRSLARELDRRKLAHRELPPEK